MTNYNFIPLPDQPQLDDDEMIRRADDFYTHIRKRRTVRDFSSRPVPRAVIEKAILAAGTAPNGANKQPWHFAVISSDDIKSRLREAAEEEEREFYGGRAPDSWLKDLEQFATDEHKPFLEVAPWLIVVFRQTYGINEEDGSRDNHYYVPESVGIACGMLLTALHTAGLVTLTHTPSPMNFLSEICGRPKNEKATMIVVAGHPADDCTVPDITKKPLDEIASWI